MFALASRLPRGSRHFRFSRQQLVNVASPASRVFACPIPACPSPVEHRFDAAADPARRFGLLGPYWLDHLHHERRVNSLYRLIAENWIDVSFQGARPLGCVLLVFPTGAVG